MNRNPARPKPIRIMRECACGLWYITACDCSRPRSFPGYIHIPLMVLTVSMVIVGLSFLFRG